MTLLRVLSLLVLLVGCTADRSSTDVLAAGAASPSASASPDPALQAARDACADYAANPVYELHSVYMEGDYLGEEVMPAVGATETIARIQERVAAATAEGGFQELGAAAGLLDWWGDRSEVSEVQDQMHRACELVPGWSG